MNPHPSFLHRWWRWLLAATAGLILVYSLTPTQNAKRETPNAQQPDYAADRALKDSLWRYAPDSPLPDSSRARFTGLRYFPPDPKWRVAARYDAFPTPTPLLIPIHNAEAPEPYLRVARLSFTLNGRACTLTALRRPTEPSAAPLFIPFTDASNGLTTYGGGRYLDVPAPTPGQSTLLLDFNQAYAPTCAHVPDYLCPVPPPENHLPIPIEAGER